MHQTHTFLAPAKINLFLHITGQRTDGYHLLQSAFRLITLYDHIHIKVRDDGHIVRTQVTADIPESNDLSIRAARLLQQHTQCTLGAEISVEKHIPMGAGLGGGSADAATVLMALNHLWQLQLTREQLMTLGLSLGADVPFFIFGQSAWVEGIGEIMQAITLPESHYVVLTPRAHVSTAEIFSSKELTRNSIPTTIAAFHESCAFMQDSETEKDQVAKFRNDLSPVVYNRYPSVAACADWLNQHRIKGTSCAKMSGSGASVFIECESSGIAQTIYSVVPEKINNVAVFACIASGLDQHPLYNLVM